MNTRRTCVLKLAYTLYVLCGTALLIWLDAERFGHSLLSIRSLGQALLFLAAWGATWAVLRWMIRRPGGGEGVPRGRR